AQFELARAYAVTQPEQVAEHLSHATNMFRELGARLDLQKAEETSASLDRSAALDSRRSETIAQLLTLRLAEAVASRELLLHELAAVIRQETKANRIVIIEPNTDAQRVVIAHGCDRTEGEQLAERFAAAREDAERRAFARKHDVAIIALEPSNAPPATLLISPSNRAELPGTLTLRPLLRIVELGLDLCALREHTRTTRATDDEAASAGASLMPGFIHSSPAMTKLVEEVHKIRSSDVT